MNVKTAAMLATALCALPGCTSITMNSYKGGYFGNAKEIGQDVHLMAAKVRGPVYSLPYTVLVIEGGHCVSSEPAKPKAEEPKKTDTDKTNITITNSPTTTSTSSADLGAGGGAPAKGGGDGDKKCDPSLAASPYGIKITAQTMADRSQTYQVGFDLSGFSSDNHKLKAENGLLTSSNSQSKDESREAIVAFGKLVGTVLGAKTQASGNKIAAFLELGDGATPPVGPPPPPPPPPLKPFRLVCDMSEDLTTGGPLTCEQKAAGGPPNAISVGTPVVTVSFQHNKALPTPTIPPPANGGPADQTTRDKTCFASGVCPGLLFRTRSDMVVNVEVTPTDLTKYTATGATFVVPVVDARRTYSATPVRRTFVQSKTDMTFDRGVLTSLEGDYPSTGGAILSLPVDLITAIVNGAKDFLTLRIELVGKEKDLKKASAEEETDSDDGGDTDSSK